jgi:hypothetical protein
LGTKEEGGEERGKGEEDASLHQFDNKSMKKHLQTAAAHLQAGWARSRKACNQMMKRPLA